MRTSDGKGSSTNSLWNRVPSEFGIIRHVHLCVCVLFIIARTHVSDVHITLLNTHARERAADIIYMTYRARLNTCARASITQTESNLQTGKSSSWVDPKLWEEKK